MSPVNLFNSTVLVLWATWTIPYALKHDKKWIIWLSSIVMLPIEIALCLKWANRAFPFDLLAAFAIFLFALVGGHVAHHFYNKFSEDKNERANEY